jgi:DNA-binding XRE family transcriptional regulator
VSVFDTLRERDLNDPALSPLRHARLTFDGHGMTVAALAIRAGLSAPTIRAAEHGRVTPRTKRKLARALGREVTDLFPEADRAA